MTEQVTKTKLTDDEYQLLLSTVEDAARDAGAVITIRGAMWSPIFRGVERIIAERMAQAWDEGHQRGLRDADVQHEADNPYQP